VPDRQGPAAHYLVVALRELGAVDRAVYEAVARTLTATLDDPVRRLSHAADKSRLWLGIAAAAAAALAGGRRGRRAALEGMVPIGVTSATVNLGVKQVARRRRPDRDHPAAFEDRHVPMPQLDVVSPPATPPRPSPTPSAATCPPWPCRSACWPPPSPTPESTPASTIRATW